MNTITDTHRVLVIADTWCQVDGLCDQVRAELAGEHDEVLVIAPPLSGKVHTIFNDTDGETELARRRLDDVLRRLLEHGVAAHGRVSDGNPVVAIDDVLVTFPAERVVVVTEADCHQNWLERRLPGYLLALGIPTTQLLVPHELAQIGGANDA